MIDVDVYKFDSFVSKEILTLNFIKKIKGVEQTSKFSRFSVLFEPHGEKKILHSENYHFFILSFIYKVKFLF